ncbi:methylated-DNA--[protein]-cysteine S-methyltransferase [Rhodospirillaceae bacterium KN72]|uniref:Methylated-DNA--protein-cysteine methyltransferase n=1 Tax=Pacificispira spongiicola TaxID=2729598 RepID=A0A7Y0DZC8_9PROT|nr:methylated-DNA--[protein]-cysteine S-methyltransferase [Pacificispira spongiicola]NMM44369.1 methylated-DNA--[protein]-cysteine S-methyltransferase [Pacificispira spongiicola]
MKARIDSPVGGLVVEEADGAIIRLDWQNGPIIEPATEILKAAVDQLRAYFTGNLTVFDLPLNPAGTTFQQSVHAAMLAIPFGETRSYGDIAKDLGVPAQPIGQACGANPIPIIIPCHRVLAADGKLGGFSGRGGVETKVALLRHEGAAGLLI